ncbi:hypothetical protein [Jannaschia ovalis]|uniref:EF-hand domain-containing protein n=1 Tax=Jannaschia ovalis TaxID=3038773 RepID=A0ABY8LC35_9RHOB|nr:hypothetical protein [Jannaschia sp. GRR-S6-38]WGH77958.1 hypothetical protein P8627_13085 [Jannaschia sp. GRR-S6-38]
MTKLTTTIAALLMTTAPAFAEMGDYDGDGDGMLSDVEFGEAEGGLRFRDYDTDGSGDVSDEEFRAGEFRRYDRDRDGAMNDEEYSGYEADRADMDDGSDDG